VTKLATPVVSVPAASGALGRLLVIGGGGHAWVVTEAARAQGWRVLGYFDDDESTSLGDKTPRLGPISGAAAATAPAAERGGPGDEDLPWAVIALGSLDLRARLIQVLPGLYAVVRHPSAIVSPSARIGAGTFIGATAVVQGRTQVGDHTIINTGAIVEHDCVIGINVHIAPGAKVGGGVRIGRDTLVGIGSSIRPGVKIGSGCTIGVGAAVVSDVPDNARAIGVPARATHSWSDSDDS